MTGFIFEEHCSKRHVKLLCCHGVRVRKYKVQGTFRRNTVGTAVFIDCGCETMICLLKAGFALISYIISGGVAKHSQQVFFFCKNYLENVTHAGFSC